ncbi:MAG: hypothetical protein H8E66_01700 [Planctomycetes bacterium]|nr:hypothetical protein [Planctomycetota bacterium]
MTKLNVVNISVVIVIAASFVQSVPAADEQIRVSLDQGRFSALMPVTSVSAYSVNTASRVYFDQAVMMHFSSMRLTEGGLKLAAKEPRDFITRYSQGQANVWPGRVNETVTNLTDTAHPSIEHRFQHAGTGDELPKGYLISRMYYVGTRICTLLINVRLKEYEENGAAVQLITSRFLDSLKIDDEMPPGSPLVHSATRRADWIASTTQLKQKFASGSGMIAERFAFCQTMPIDDFYWVAEELRASGYRPITFRPYSDGKKVQVAAVWTRDGGRWILVSGQVPTELERLAEQQSKTSTPIDVAGWEAHERSYFGVLWHISIPKRGVNKLIVGELDDDYAAHTKQVGAEGYRARRRHRLHQSDGKIRSSLIAYKPRPNSDPWHIRGDSGYYKKELKGTRTPYDLSLALGENGRISYTASFSNAPIQYKEAHGLSPSAHLAKCKSFAAMGYVPVALSVTNIGARGNFAASIWHQRIAEP